MEQNNNLIVKRPKIIKVFCILGFIIMFFVLLAIIVPSTRESFILQHGIPYFMLGILEAIIYLIALIGYWMMRKWGVYAYFIITLINIGQAIMDSASAHTIINGLYGIAISFCILAIGYRYILHPEKYDYKS